MLHDVYYCLKEFTRIKFDDWSAFDIEYLYIIGNLVFCFVYDFELDLETEEILL